MQFSLSVAALFAIYGQALSEGLGQVYISQHNPQTGLEYLDINGQTPVVGLSGPYMLDHQIWKISQVGATSAGERLVNIQSQSTSSYISCSTTEENVPCHLSHDKYSIQAFIERPVADSGPDGPYEFIEQKTEKHLYTTDGRYLSLSAQPDSELATLYWLSPHQG